jgi:hypothetical protein
LKDTVSDPKCRRGLRGAIAWAACSLALIGVFEAGRATAPINLSGTYSAESAITTAPIGEPGDTHVVPLELRINLTDVDGALKGDLRAQVRDLFLPLTFSLTGERRDLRVRLKLEISLCLEGTTVMLEGTMAADGAIEMPSSSQAITCNFGRVRIGLPHAVRLVREARTK